MILDVAVLAAFAFVFSLISARIANTVFTGPMFFVLFGLMIGPWGLDLLTFDVGAGDVRILADWTLALILFTDAADANRSALIRKAGIPERMLFLGLPLVIVAGCLVGRFLFPQLDFYQVAIVATCLAATDAALGKEALHDREVPSYLRTGLNVESGLNDGFAVPILLVLVGLSVAQQVGEVDVLWVALIVLREIGVGMVVGICVVGVGVALMQQAKRLEWMDPVWSQIPVVALAICAFGFAQLLDGSGFIAAFCAGLAFRHLTKRLAHTLIFSATEVGETLSLVVWVLFGSVMLDMIVPMFDFVILAYALLSLTIVRLVPIIFSLAYSGETIAAKIYLGWFGPRGLASLIFVVLVAESGVHDADLIVGIVFLTVLLSVFIHGFSTHPVSGALAKWDQRLKRDRNATTD